MFSIAVPKILSTIALVCLGLVDACKLAPIPKHDFQIPICSAIPSISVDFVVNPTLSYLRPTEVELNSPSLSISPEYFAASAGAIAMTETLNDLFSELKTIHHGPNTLVGISLPIVLNQTDGSQCISWANLTVIPQYNLSITNIGVSGTYAEEGAQGITNNRESCQICNVPSPPFAVIHGIFDNAGLYDVTSQVCNAFNVPTIAVSITDQTFQELYPEAAASARWSALASIGPTQIGAALNAFMNQFNWHSVTVFLDPTNTAQANEVVRGFQLEGISISSQLVDYYGTGCSVAINNVMIGMVSIIYLDLGINRISECIGQILASGLMDLNYIVVWGPSLMASVSNNFTTLANSVGLPLSNFTGTFTLQVRTQDASYYSLLVSNFVEIYNSWNDSYLYQSLAAYPTALQDNANSVVLASQGIYGFLADNLCSFVNRGLVLNLSDTISNIPTLVETLSSGFATLLSNSHLGMNYSVISPSSQQSWTVQLDTQKLNIVPNNVFFFYTENSGYWSEAVNMAKWFHDGSGNSVTTFDVYNLQSLGNSGIYPIGSYISRTFSWIYNTSSVIAWPNPTSLWQYISGIPGDTPPLTSLTLDCVAGFSCSSSIVEETPSYSVSGQIMRYSTQAVISNDGVWELGIQCSGGGGTLFYTASIAQITNPDSFIAWTLSLNQKSAEIRLNFDSELLDPNKWAGGSSVLSFSCFDKNNVLNGTLDIFINNDDSQYTPSPASRLLFIVLNSAGIALTFIGAGMTLFYKHRRPIYSSSISFLLIAWLGFAIIFGSGIVSILPVTGDMICQAKSWLFNYGFVLVMGSLVLKTFHIHRIFNNDKLMIYRISIGQFILSLGSMLMIVTIVMLIWENAGDFSLHRNSSFQPYCVTGSWVPFHIIAGFEFLLILGCLWLSYQIRGVHHDYNESKCIGFIVYNTAVWGIAWWVISSQISISPATLSLLTSLFICVVCALDIAIFFAPKFYAISVEDAHGLVVTPHQGSNRLAHSKNSNENNSATNVSIKSQQKSFGKITSLEVDFALPPDGKEALKYARDKLFETARKWRTNDMEHAKLKKKIHDCEILRVQDSELINSWMGTIQNILTSGQVSPKDSEALIIQMWKVLSMRGSEIIEEAERHESFRKKKDINATATASINLPKSIASTAEMLTMSSASSVPAGGMKFSSSTAEMTNVNPNGSSPHLAKSSVSSSPIDGSNFANQVNSINRRNFI